MNGSNGGTTHQQGQQRISKKRKAKIDKIKSDAKLTDLEKEEQIEMLMI